MAKCAEVLTLSAMEGKATEIGGVVQAGKMAKLTCFKELRFAETTALAVSPFHHAKAASGAAANQAHVSISAFFFR